MIDAHVHVLPERVIRDAVQIGETELWFAACHAGGKPMAGEQELLEYLEREQIEKAVIFTWPFSSAELCREANDYVASLLRRHPDRLIACGIIQPRSPDASAELKRCHDLGLRGIGELNCDAQGFAVDDESISELAGQSARLGMFWNIHSSEPVGHEYPGKGMTTPDRLLRLVQRTGDLKIVCAHLGGGLPFYAHMKEVAEVCRHLWFDTAAAPFVYQAAALRHVVEAIGFDRLVFGSDFPLLGVQRYRDFVAAAGLPEAAQPGLWGGNLETLLG